MSENSLKVSIIIPVYNSEKYLRECLDSVVNQTLQDIEIICVNDGSTDGSLAILREYETKDPRLRVIDQENTGPAAARNRGLDLAQGEYIQFVDSDDIVEVSLCEKTYNLAIAEVKDVVVFNLGRMKDGKIISKTYSFKSLRVEKDRIAWLFKTHPGPCTKLVRKSLYIEKNIRFPSKLKMGEDQVVHCHICCAIQSFAVISDCLYYYRRNFESLSYSKKFKIDESIFPAYKMIDKIVESNEMSLAFQKIVILREIHYYPFHYHMIERKDRILAKEIVRDFFVKKLPNVDRGRLSLKGKLHLYYFYCFYYGIIERKKIYLIGYRLMEAARDCKNRLIQY